ncbi:hypothetical protein MD484_g6883, partial [Candolleomyces efflorescens]
MRNDDAMAKRLAEDADIYAKAQPVPKFIMFLSPSTWATMKELVQWIWTTLSTCQHLLNMFNGQCSKVFSTQENELISGWLGGARVKQLIVGSYLVTKSNGDGEVGHVRPENEADLVAVVKSYFAAEENTS